MKRKDVEKVAVFIAVFLGFAAFMYGTIFDVVYKSFSAIVLLGFLYLTHRLISFFPKAIIQIRDWQNKERKVDFYISKVFDSILVTNSHCVIVSCPKDCFLYGKTSFRIGVKKIEYFMPNANTPNPLNIEFIPIPFDKSFSKNLLWRSNKEEVIKIEKNSPQIIDLFQTNNNGAFSVTSESNNLMDKAQQNFGIGNHDFIMNISARDSLNRLFVQDLIMKINFDGKLITTISFAENRSPTKRAVGTASAPSE